MAIRIYEYNYDNGKSTMKFKVDTAIFTEEHAKATLEFFIWPYDEMSDPIDEVLDKYALTAIAMAFENSYGVNGVKAEFHHLEGFCAIDGSNGIELLELSKYEFDQSLLDCEIIIKATPYGNHH